MLDGDERKIFSKQQKCTQAEKNDGIHRFRENERYIWEEQCNLHILYIP